MILNLQKCSVAFRTRLSELWKDFSLVIKNLNEVPLSDINQYQILVLKNLSDDKYKDKLEQMDAQIEAEMLKHTEINKQL